MNIKIPSDRIGAVIGPNGETKRYLEERCSVSLDIDSESGAVTVTSQGDALDAMRAIDVLRAIARGFSPERAFALLDDDMLMLDILDLSSLAATKNDLIRIKGRIIGKDGKTRELMESLTGARISVYGKTVSIIGYPEQIKVVRSALEMLIDGAPHGNVYSFLEKKRRDLLEMEL
ncbi:MAG: RNA-processing protein [Methanothrix sp.]|jgi:arCOG04150 universal archaeal KH domain protein|uniref:KH, type 1, domain protein n=2 Tax=Methanothrix TaxID=2222 RepID=A0B5J6_METTP|nr:MULTISPECIES: KH domain-containing protein [Methanothrix]ABK13970.1 KH, type 1, domain protein [Methanothrix thermoacetophila PT]MBC7079853.1 RNA-processing protein [Methanothrix sp.]NPU88004.1 RNA-processing protein [Methanothrix sp.]